MIDWSEERKPDGVNNFYDYVSFICPVFGEFKIEWKSWKEYDTYDCWESFINVSEPTLEEAKIEFSKQYIAATKKMLAIAEGEKLIDNFELHEQATILSDTHSSYELARKLLACKQGKYELISILKVIMDDITCYGGVLNINKIKVEQYLEGR